MINPFESPENFNQTEAETQQETQPKKLENLEGVEGFVNNINSEIEELKNQQEETIKERDEIVENMAGIFGVSLDEFKSKIEHIVGGWPYENATPAKYGFDELSPQDDSTYTDLMHRANKLFRDHQSLELAIQKNSNRIGFIEGIQTEEDKEGVAKSIEDPNQYTTNKIDDLSDSGIFTESEIIQAMKNRISSLEEIYKGEPPYLEGPHGDTPEFELSMRLDHVSDDMLKKLKASRQLGETFDKAFDMLKETKE